MAYPQVIGSLDGLPGYPYGQAQAKGSVKILMDTRGPEIRTGYFQAAPGDVVGS